MAMDTMASLPNIGALTTNRLRDVFHITTVAEFHAHIAATVNPGNQRGTRIALLRFIHRVTENPRACECLEGYSVRRFNARAYDALVALMHVAPEVRPPFVGAVRGPSEPAPPYSADLVRRDGAAFPRGRDDYVMANPLRGTVAAAARDTIINAPNSRASARKTWPCACFRRLETCTDFAADRLNRAPGVRPCEWVDARCVNAQPIPPVEGQAGRGRGGPRGRGAAAPAAPAGRGAAVPAAPRGRGRGAAAPAGAVAPGRGRGVAVPAAVPVGAAAAGRRRGVAVQPGAAPAGRGAAVPAGAAPRGRGRGAAVPVAAAPGGRGRGAVVPADAAPAGRGRGRGAGRRRRRNTHSNEASRRSQRLRGRSPR